MSVVNDVKILGRIGSDPEVRYSQGEKATAFASFSVATQRNFKNKDGNYDTDWIRCTASGKTAEFIEKYFHKGDVIALRGWLKTGSYEKDGVKHFTTDVQVDEVSFVPGTKNGEGGQSNNAKGDAYINVPTGVDEELPFN